MQRTINIQIVLNDHSARLTSSQGVDIESCMKGSEEQKIADLLQALCLAFEVHPRGTYSHIWN
ncbi:MAG: hypothetical protein KME46_33330 [Brasilonema angustatum HA4187-MV1]|jgi:hypothetical protein|nr:hypothetical protein [Brasilonema angustatum HA4187-MV1]